MIPIAHELLDHSFWEKGQTYLDRMAASMQAVVRVGSHVMLGIMQSGKAIPNPTVASLALLRQTLSLADAASVLVQNGVGSPTIPLVRAMMESLLSGMYLLEADREQRGNCFIIADVLQELRWLESATAGTERHAQFTASVQGDRMANAASPSRMDPSEIAKRCEQIRAYCKHPDRAAIATEWEGLNRNNRRTKWYSLFKGPPSVKDLAVHLKQNVRYEVLYRYWSSHAHSESALDGFAIGKGVATARPLRAPFHVDLTYTIVNEMALRHSRLVLDELGSREQTIDFNYFYLAHVMDEYEALRRVHFNWSD